MRLNERYLIILAKREYFELHVRHEVWPNHTTFISIKNECKDSVLSKKKNCNYNEGKQKVGGGRDQKYYQDL